MSRPDPYRRQQGPRPPYQPPEQYPPRQPYGQRPPQPYGHQPPAQQPPYPPQRPYQPEPEPPYYDDDRDSGGGFRLPGLGLILTLLSLVVQALSFLLLPWFVSQAGGGPSVTAPDIWDLLMDGDPSGFGSWYLVLFGYPLAALGVVLAFVSVLESVALKIIWGGLAIVGLGWLVLRYGFGPFTGLVEDSGAGLTRQEITTAIIAVGALVVVIVMLKMAMSMFRRVAGVILLIAAGVHLYAIQDFDADSLGIGAYGPAAGYLLAAAAAFIGPRRLLPGV
jgi:hypothetical protein